MNVHIEGFVVRNQVVFNKLVGQRINFINSVVDNLHILLEVVLKKKLGILL